MVFASRWCGVVCLVLAFSHCQVSGANLLTNPGFEGSTPPAFGPAWVLTTVDTLYDKTVIDGGIHNSEGVVGTFLGNADENNISSLYQVVALNPGNYIFSFDWRFYTSNTYTPGANKAILTAYFGPAAALPPSFSGGTVVDVDGQVNTPFVSFSVMPALNVPIAGNYYVGWTWYNWFGEYAVDNAKLEEQVPEPSTFALLLIPVAGMIYARRKK